MSLLTRFQEWRADRLRERRGRDYEAGRQYALQCLRSRMHRPEVHLYNLTNSARDFGDYTPFDAGIESVLRAIPRLENHL